MTANKRFKARVRARANRTGESYSAARRHLLSQNAKEAPMSDTPTLAAPINDGVAECIAFYALDVHHLVTGLTTAEAFSQTARNNPGVSLDLPGFDAETGHARTATIQVSALHHFIADQVRAITVTQEVTEVLEDTYSKAVDLGHGYVGQEHLVAVIAESTDTEITNALGALGVSSTTLLDLLSTYLQPIGRTEPVVPGWSPRAVRALNVARREAGAAPPSAAHLILGVIAEGEGLGASAFAHAGISLHNARLQLLTSS
jgi:hypothetical protein